MKHGYLIDMDGVIYRGHELIPGADRFVQQLRTREIPFCFLTFGLIARANSRKLFC